MLSRLKRSLRLQDQESDRSAVEDIARRIDAGEAYNRVVMNQRLSSYFESAIRELGLSHDDEDSQRPSVLDYIVPGRVPEDDEAREIYARLMLDQDTVKRKTRSIASLLLLLFYASESQSSNSTPPESEELLHVS